MKAFSKATASIFILACLLSLSHQCVYLQSGVTTITRSFNQEDYTFQFTPSFIAPNNRAVQAVASATNLQVTWINKVDFSIMAQHNPNTNRVVIVLSMGSGNLWNSIQISYFISGRPQFYLGTYTANVYIDSSIANGQVFSQVVPILNWTPSNAFVKAVVQYSGIRANQNTITLATTSLTANPSSGTMTLSLRVLPSTARVHYIEFSYIVFIQNPVTHTSLDYFGTIPPADYVWVGIQSINGVSSSFKANAFSARNVNSGLTCIGALCGNQQCLTVQTCFSLGGQVIGNNCFRCRQGQTVINNQCTSSIGPQCGLNYQWNGIRCVCRSNFIQLNNNCVPTCGANAYILNGNCICIPGFTRIGQSCVQGQGCPFNQAINPITNSCINCFTQGHFIQNFVCRCSPPFFMTANGCQQNSLCPPSTLNCLGVLCSGQLCLSYQQCFNFLGQVIGNNCFRCRQGQTVINNQCTSSFGPQCGLNYQWNGVRCVCRFNFIQLNNTCVPTCGANAYILNGNCVCIPGFTRIGQSCVQGQGCLLNQAINPITNLCINCFTQGHYIQNLICRCFSPFFMTANGCQQTCPPNSTPNPQTQVCTCNPGFQSQNNICIPIINCVPPQFLINGVCQCPPGQALNLNTNQCNQCQFNFIQNNICVCPPQFFLTTTGCSTSCPPNSQFNSLTNSCQCFPGFQLINNLCFPINDCPGGQIRVGGVCVCPFGQGLNNLTSSCISCNTLGSILDNNLCTCALTHYLTVNGCVACPFNTVYSTTFRQCVCNQRFYLDIQNVCQPCHSTCLNCFGTSSTQCISCIDASAPINGVCTLVCQPGSYLTINTCLPCPTNCTSCSGPLTCTTCQAGFNILTVGPAVSCIATCPPGTFALSNICQACSNNCSTCTSASNCLTCVSGFNLLNGISSNTCVATCPTGTYVSANTCQVCSNNCTSCSGATTCITCQFGFSLLTVGTNVSCVVTCPNGTFLGTSGCQNCSSTCLTCTNLTVCTSCSASLFLSGTTCVAACPAGTFVSGTFCQSCLTNCSTCSSPTTCTACNPGFNLLTIGITVTCNSFCPPATFQIANSCQNCSVNCSTCLSAAICTACLNGSSLLTGVSGSTCVTICPDGRYSFGNVCVICPANCVRCTAANACTQCSPNFNLLTAGSSTTCVSVCPQGTFFSIVNNAGTCLSCLPNCIACTNSNTCTNCSAGFTLTNNGGNLICNSSNKILRLRNLVVNNIVILYGLSISDLPTSVKNNNCAQCNSIFTLTNVSGTLPLNSGVVYVNNTSFWFIIRFPFPPPVDASVIPTFTFKVNINQAITGFTAQEYQMSVVGSISQDIVYPPEPQVVVTQFQGPFMTQPIPSPLLRSRSMNRFAQKTQAQLVEQLFR